MILGTIATGSKGNCYLLKCDNQILILDCGIPIMEIKKSLNFDLSKVVGAICTHGHLDHSKSADDLKNMGIRVWQPYKYEVEMNRTQRRYFGAFMVRNFDVEHDNEPCCGFLIECPNGQRLLYATDFEYIKYSFTKWQIHHLLIECNYQSKYVSDQFANRNHVLRGHAELQTTIGVVKDNVSDSLQNVILCHLSNGNANAREMVAEVQKVAKNANVCVAEEGLEIELCE